MTSGQSGSGSPVVRPVVNRPSTNSILVNRRQEKNPLLELLRNVAWEYAAISPDFQVGATTCALFLSLRYHRLHPEYVHRRISDLGHSFTLRIMIFLVDAKDPENEIKELTKICLINGLTIMAAWSLDEVAQYLTTYKAYENKSPNMIMEHIDQDYPSILRSALTSIKGVNKTDVTTLRTRFGDFASMSHATFDELNLCPGFGKVKARRVKDAFDKPFYPGRTGPVGGSQLKGKGKEREQDDQFMSEPIEEQGNDGGGSKGALDDPARGFSPDWDIDLDLNESDHEDEEGSGNTIQIQSPSPHPPSTKKKKPNPVVRSEWD
ncbi:ssDNA endonuclease and repair protein rad10 [Tulasnella sp. JGI-2019a]|nr:ssDNA endonuclease and repair protein rad10 [Tulasnella sp. JGI-2019a]